MITHSRRAGAGGRRDGQNLKKRRGNQYSFLNIIGGGGRKPLPSITYY